jgi:hypothetical protein
LYSKTEALTHEELYASSYAGRKLVRAGTHAGGHIRNADASHHEWRKPVSPMAKNILVIEVAVELPQGHPRCCYPNNRIPDLEI